MLEFIWHARGGQGAFTAARCLGAAAALSAGAYALAFPTFGPERRGAPMRAFTKIDTAPIGDRSAVHRAAFVIYLDETLVEDGWEDELAPGGLMLLNTKRALDDPRILGIDADGISAAALGRPIPNTVFLGVIPALAAAVTIEDIHAGICATMPEKLHAKNLRIVDAAFAEVASREIAATRDLVAAEQAATDVTAVLSGGQGTDEPITEAECMYRELVNLGIDPQRLWMEEDATSTWENLNFSLDLIEEKTGERPQKLGVLSSEYHLYRASRFAKACGVEFVGIPAKTSRLSQKINHFMREVAGVWHYILLGGNYD